MRDWSDLATELLPKLLQDFVRLIGLAATMQLVQAFGGVRLFVPLNPTPEHPLAKLIGFDNLVTLSRIYGGNDHFDVPKAERALKALRDAKIRAEYGPKSLRTLALEHRLTERQVLRIVGAAASANEDQEGLFG